MVLGTWAEMVSIMVVIWFSNYELKTLLQTCIYSVFICINKNFVYVCD